MLRWIGIAVLTLGLVGTGVWGYQEHREKNAVLIQAENTYQRSFHDLSYHMDLLHDKIGTTLAMNSKEQLSPQLAEIWRLTSEAHSDVGQLPLALLPFNKTEEFLSKIGTFSYRTAVRDLNNKPLSDKEVEQLQTLYEQSGEIEQELRKVQSLVLENNLRWMDVQLALASSEQQADNTIIDGFKTVEKTVKGFEEGNLGTTLTGVSAENHDYKFIQGQKITKEKAKKKARDFFGVGQDTEIRITESGDGADVAMYSASYKENGKHGYLDLSVKGGHLLSYIVNRDIEAKKLSLHAARTKAEKYLEENGFKNMQLFQSSQYDNVGVFSFLYTQDDVRVYPDSIQVKVGLDDGELLGLSTRDYYRNHQERQISEPEISEAEARKKVNPNIKVQEAHLSIINNDLQEEVLVYEFLGVLDNETYRIFINANTGMEEKVEPLKTTKIKFKDSV
ncbi:germination protein YpeB [Radiobacillus kanasensis]|uniref:germination protein YpeB n=1 Tax=Radiobacillus kanasensis TaxID=2844358 RepID=UPI001E4E5AE8|nr:germination protein YpeB [Radiobacillus kanasensis]UFT97643.1 germination protein YpeB [Radiobacillus kanasensis]